MKIAVYDVPLLYEKQLENQFDAVIFVWAEEHHQKDRAKKRNKWSDEEIMSRLKSQLSMQEKKKRAHHVIENTSGLAELEKSVEQVLKNL